MKGNCGEAAVTHQEKPLNDKELIFFFFFYNKAIFNFSTLDSDHKSVDGKKPKMWHSDPGCCGCLWAMQREAGIGAAEVEVGACFSSGCKCQRTREQHRDGNCWSRAASRQKWMALGATSVPWQRLAVLLLESPLCLGSTDVQDGCSAVSLLPRMVSRSQYPDFASDVVPGPWDLTAEKEKGKWDQRKRK